MDGEEPVETPAKELGEDVPVFKGEELAGAVSGVLATVVDGEDCTKVEDTPLLDD